MYRWKWFKTYFDLVEFLNDKKISKDNIVKISDQEDGFIYLVWFE